MGTITKRVRKDGSTVYRAEVRLHEGKTIVARRSATFDKHAEAARWVARTEGRLHEQAARAPALTVGQLIERYVARMAHLRPLGRTRSHVLAALQRRFADTPAAGLTQQSLIDFAQERRDGGAGPATVLLDIGTLNTVYRDALPILGIPLDDTVFRQARPLLQRLGLIAKPAKRSRRPGESELDRLMAGLRKRQAHSGALLPMTDLVAFLIYSCMRLSEMTGLLWADVDEPRRTVIVRDRKHPTQKTGNHQIVALLGPAWEVLQRQPRLHERIFPYDSRSISAAFARVCAQLGIPDLHLHDLRRHGISRLLEMGYTPSEVAAISGHRSLAILHTVYTAITPEHLHDKYQS